METSSYRNTLKTHLESRIAQNRNYSLRAYARDLGISSAQLSRVLNGKRNLSPQTAELIAEKLYRDDRSRNLFVGQVVFETASDEKTRDRAQNILENLTTKDDSINLQLEVFKVISDWHHTAIMELTFLDNFDQLPSKIATTLRITEMEAKIAIERLLELGLLKYEKNRLVKTETHLKTPTDIPSTNIRKFHKQMMEKAIESLEEQNVIERYITAKTIAINKDQIPEFKELIEEFKKRIGKLAKSSKSKNKVYQFNIQMFDLTKRKKI